VAELPVEHAVVSRWLRRILVSKDVETRKNLRSTSVYVQNLGPDCRRAYGRHIEFEHGLGDFARDFDAGRYPELLAYRRASPVARLPAWRAEAPLRDPAELIASVRRGLSCAGGWLRMIRLPGGAEPLTATRVTAGPLPPQ